MKPICVPCQRFYRIKKTGYYFTEMMPKGNDRPLPGPTEADRWQPYKTWSGDLWECRGCGTQIISGFGALPVSERHVKGFEEQRKRLGADQFQVNDC
jgi:hypothetical protein